MIDPIKSKLALSKHGRYHLLLAFGCLSLVSTLLVQTSDSVADTQPVELSYKGELRDESNKPIAGIYPLEFKLYRNSKDTSHIWRETHWVAVNDGRYDLRLGAESPIRTANVIPGQTLFLGVFLKGGGELFREPVKLPENSGSVGAKTDDPDRKASSLKSDKEIAKTPSKTPTKTPAATPSEIKTDSSFATLAQHAYTADKAEDAKKLDGRSIEYFEKELENLRNQIASIRAELRQSGPSLGSNSTALPRAGGVGGGAFERSCPPGHVITGINGTAGTLVDSIQPICSPLK